MIKLELTEQEFDVVKFALEDMRKSIGPMMNQGPWVEVWRKIDEI